MLTFGRAFRFVVPSLILGGIACSPSAKPPSDLHATGGSETGARGGASGSGAVSGGGTGGGVDVSGGSGGVSGTGASGLGADGGGSGTDIQTCAKSDEMGMAVPLDVYVMLDISGSMLDPSGAAGSTTTKWDSVKSALASFFGDAQSAGLSVAIQYFPLRIAGVPTSCATDADCGAGAPCLTNICKLNTGDALIACSVPNDTADCTNAVQRDDGPCVTEPGATTTTCHLSGKACTADADCQSTAFVDNGPCQNGTCRVGAKACTTDADCHDTALGACVDYGVCEMDNTYSCADTNTTTNPKGCGGSLGACVPATSHFCAHETQCDPDVYKVPAVDFLTLPDTANALNGSIAAQSPAGDTPSRSALRGAIAHAREWAASHAGHTVVVVLATDGLPTECSGGRGISGESPVALDDVVAVATDGLTPADATLPSVETIVIGVFADSEMSARPNLDRIAKAGGSNQAYVISSGSDVQQQFLTDLNDIRAAHLGCEFQIPEPPSGSKLDYALVNVKLTPDAGGATPSDPTTLYYVAPDGCTGAGDEWHYDKDPSAGMGAPTKIVACPATCTALKSAADNNAKISVELGCMQHIR